MSTLMVVVDDIDTPNAMGQAVVALAQSAGWQTVLAPPSVDPVSGVAGVDGVVVGIEGSSALSEDWPACPVPVLTHVWNGQMNRFGTATVTFGDNSSTTDNLQLSAAPDAEAIHSMASGVMQVVDGSPDGLRVLLAEHLVEDAVLVAHRAANGGQAVIWALESGDVQTDETPAPARRAQWIIRSAQIQILTTEGQQLWRNLAAWTFGGAPDPQDPSWLSAERVGSTTDVELSWAAPALPDATHVDIHRRTPPTGAPFDPEDPATRIARVEAGAPHGWTDTDAPAAACQYQVFAAAIPAD